MTVDGIGVPLRRRRHYGYLANGGRAAKLAHCRRLLAVPEPAPPAPAADYRERYQQLFHNAIWHSFVLVAASCTTQLFCTA